MKNCIFCKIVNKEIPADIVYEDKEILGFKNIHPEAPIHFLLIPKRHIVWKDEFDEEDLTLLGRLLSTAKKISKEKKVFEACKLIFNVGKTGHITHIHVHLLGGWGEEKIPKYNVQ